MSEYIKREDAIQALTDCPVQYVVSLCNVPSADVVEVVRCKDCKYWNGDECTGRDIFVVDDDEFCSYGERRDAD